MENKLKPNWPLLRQIMKDIAAKPLRLDMREGVDLDDSIAPCRTTACIAGWATVKQIQVKTKLNWAKSAAKIPHKNWDGSPSTVADWAVIETRAGRLLGLNYEQKERLFYKDNWPDEFKEAMIYAKNRKAESRIAVKRITHFIKTRGRE